MEGLDNARDALRSRNSIVAFLSLCVLGALPSVYFRVRVALGNRPLNYDAETVWWPIAERVLSGEPLYIPPAVDNKPPGFHLLNLLIASTGHYVSMWVIVVVLANVGIALCLVFYLTDRLNTSWRAGWVAGVAYLGTIYSTQAHMINDRPLAGVLILLALLASTAHWKGAFLAAACHMSPFSMLALPLVGLQLYDQDGLTPSQVARVALGGLVVGIIPYLIVLAMFGFESATNAVLWTVGAGPGSVPRATHGTIFVDPMGWMFTLARNTVRTQPILTVGIACALIVIPSMNSPRYRILASGTALFSLPLLVWSYIGYFIFPLMFLSSFVGIAVDYVAKNREQKHT